MAYLHVTNCAKRSVLVCLVTMLVFLLRLYGDSLGWDLLKISAYKGLPGEIFEINLIHALSLLGFYTSCSDISQKLPQNFQKLPKSCSFHEKVAQKLLFINSKKSVSTTDESKSLHIYTNYLLIYIFSFYSLTFLYLQR